MQTKAIIPSEDRANNSPAYYAESLLVLQQRIHRLRSVLAFLAFAIAVLFGGLASVADWKITVAAWLICLFTMPRFARL